MKTLKKYLYVHCFNSFVFFCCLIFVWSCSPQKRLDRLVKHHPELIKKDTAFVKDTFFLPSYKTDTTFVEHNNTITDTVYLTKDKIQVKYYHHHDTVYLSARYNGDTLVKTIKVPYDRISVYEKPIPMWYWVLLSLLSGAVVTLIFIYIKTKK